MPGTSAQIVDGYSVTSAAAVSAVYTKIMWRVTPVVLLCYILAYLDRINIGYAQLQMKSALGFSDAVYGLGAGIFFVGYLLFEVPSNLLLVKVGARRTISRIMVVWGLISASMAFIHAPWMFYALRFLLGAFEAGFFPGVVLYLTYWFPGAYRGRALAVFSSATALAGLIGGPLSGWVLKEASGYAGLAGWQWMFIIEGLPTTLMGLFVFARLCDGPGEAAWLSVEEKEMVQRDLLAERKQSSADGHGLAALWTVMRNPVIYVIAFSWFCFICGIYMINFWLPTIIKELGISDPLHVGLLAAIPYGISIAVMIAFVVHSDRTLERRWHCAVPAFIGALGLIGLVFASGNIVLSFVMLSLTAIGTTTTVPLLWSIPTAYVRGAGAAAGIAFINSLGLVGGFLSPFVLGWIKTSTGSLDWGNWLMAGLMALGGVAILVGVRPSLLREAAPGAGSLEPAGRPSLGGGLTIMHADARAPEGQP